MLYVRSAEAKEAELGVVVPLEDNKKRPGASIEPLVRLTREPMEQVNEVILARAGSNVAMIPEIARHLIDSGGKRLRPMLTIAAAGMCGLLHPTTYYRLRSPASRVGPDGNFAGPTRARMYRTRKSRKR
jgi:hypothetical protein